ncbi:FtsW/RodA/SpoVE family cell cycle protein [Cytobacillus purgationiresistens]|uniref:Cell division protein FtsW (Lipid II flippase) n=1 Tax=Cytobacillus purgationiresistens TaxID=863449 RepID=A0ABU0APH0_9BACI|nr:FtsW/RodA/SpoVE family cell cycle protein [Cytobacillus purgationiresistens]MDQ0273189.1 cell division protein FtsW (lipid II flippase) [Cytobacillus purgationiresistens]
MNERSGFLERLLSQIRTKEVRQQVKREIDSHIELSIQKLVKQGFSKEEAEKTAVAQMGDPVQLGVEMNKLHRPKIDWKLLSLYGLAILISFLPFYFIQEGQMPLLKQVVGAIIGVALVFGGMFFDYRRLKNYGYLYYLVGILLLLLVFTLGWSAYSVGGSFRFQIGSIHADSTITIPLFLLAFASLLSKKTPIWILNLLFLLPVLLYIAAIANVNAMIYTSMIFGMFIWTVRKNKNRIFTASGFLIFSIGIILFFLKEYQWQRIINIFSNKNNGELYGYIELQITKLLNEAPLLGVPRMESYLILPEAQTNFILVFLIHQLGWLPFALIMIILFGLLARMLWLIAPIKDPFGQLLIFGGSMLYSAPLLYNVFMVLGFLPISGFYVPLLSYGIVVNWLYAFIIGMVLSIFRRKDIYLPENIK